MPRVAIRATRSNHRSGRRLWPACQLASWPAGQLVRFRPHDALRAWLAGEGTRAGLALVERNATNRYRQLVFDAHFQLDVAAEVREREAAVNRRWRIFGDARRGEELVELFLAVDAMRVLFAIRAGAFEQCVLNRLQYRDDVSDEL